MSDGFKATGIFSNVKTALENFTEAERAAQIKKTAAVFEMHILNAQKKEGVWTIDLKEKGTIYEGAVQAPAKAGVIMTMNDDTFEQIATGKLDAQKAFMTGKLKTKGNIMLAGKLLPVFEATRAKAKL